MPVAFPFLAEPSTNPDACSHRRGSLKLVRLLGNRLRLWAKMRFAALMRFPLDAKSFVRNGPEVPFCSPRPPVANGESLRPLCTSASLASDLV